MKGTSKSRKLQPLSLSFIPLAGGVSALIIHVGKLATGYWLRETGGRDDGQGFELAKAPSRGEQETYYVHVGSDGHASCDCKGYEYRGLCKHAEAVRSLIERGTLPPAPTAGALPAAA
jgi:hypothetical protein